MGCGTSKAAVVVANTAMEPRNNKMKKVEGKKSTTDEEKTPNSTESSTSLETDSETDINNSRHSLPNTNKIILAVSRQSSAKSKDSGLGVDNEADHITANKSSLSLKREIDVHKKPPKTSIKIDNKKMMVSGRAEHRRRNTIKLPPVKPRGRAKEDIELEAILQKRVKFADALINELPTTNSIVKRPVSRGGVAFDIITDNKESNSEALPVEEVAGRPVPLCVRNYAKRQRLVDTVTKTALEKKQRAAEQRRKEIEQMRLERLMAQKEKDRQVAEALEKFAAMKKSLKKMEPDTGRTEDRLAAH